MLPCNVVVQEISGNRTEVAAIDPVASMQAIDNPASSRLPSAFRRCSARLLTPCSQRSGTAPLPGELAWPPMTDIVALCMNPSIDISTSVDRVMPLRKLRCAATKRDPGGGGINVAHSTSQRK